MDIYWTYTKKWQADIVMPILFDLRNRGALVYWSESPGIICIRLTPVAPDRAGGSTGEDESPTRAAGEHDG